MRVLSWEGKVAGRYLWALRVVLGSPLRSGKGSTWNREAAQGCGAPESRPESRGEVARVSWRARHAWRMLQFVWCGLRGCEVHWSNSISFVQHRKGAHRGHHHTCVHEGIRMPWA